MKIRQVVAIVVIGLAPVPGAAQGMADLAGKWVVDQSRMQEIDPAWDGVVTRDMWIATFTLSGGHFRLARSVDADEVRSIRNEDRYDPAGNPTTVYVGESEATATAHWDGERLVARIVIADGGVSFTRVFYRDGQWLVVEEPGRPDACWSRTYFVKS